MLLMRDDRYWPRQFEEMAEDAVPVTIINEPLPPDNVRALVPRQRSLHAVLCEALMNTQALLARLESGVTVPKDQQREVSLPIYMESLTCMGKLPRLPSSHPVAFFHFIFYCIVFK